VRHGEKYSRFQTERDLLIFVWLLLITLRQIRLGREKLLLVGLSWFRMVQVRLG
jgi:hypothetical protein